MKLRVLGCSGGIGGKHHQTTSFLVDHDILIDVGTGATELSIAELAAIDHVFLTHAHLDHIAALPMMIDSVADRRDKPLTVYATEGVIDSLRKHIFNWAIWPDFSMVPTARQPFLCYRPIALAETISLAGRHISVLPANHTVPAVGYRLDSGTSSLVFSGDTGPCDAFWEAVNAIPNLRHLLIECAFPNRESRLAELSRHYWPDKLATELTKLTHPCQIYISHLKPGQVEATMEEINRYLEAFAPVMLQNGQVIEF
jgi:ribonuclease BN (tRNA processing enzyme)